MAEDPMEPYKRAGEEFRRAADASAKRFRSTMQRAVKRMRAAEEQAKLEMERAKTQFEAELGSARVKLEARLACLREAHPIPGQRKAEKVSDPADAAEELARLTAEFQDELDRARATFKAGNRVQRPRREPEMERHDEHAHRKIGDLKRARQELRAAKADARRGRRGWRKIAPFQQRVEWLAMEAIRKPPKPPKRRRRRPDDGSEMAPVKPRPNPTPLMDGAEAPIE